MKRAGCTFIAAALAQNYGISASDCIVRYNCRSGSGLRNLVTRRRDTFKSETQENGTMLCSWPAATTDFVKASESRCSATRSLVRVFAAIPSIAIRSPWLSLGKT